MSYQGTALVYAIHRTEQWWSHIGENLGYEKSVIVTDIRHTGDHSVVDDFYAEYRRQKNGNVRSNPLLSDVEIDDVIARCRLLRWLPKRKAIAMINAMAYAFDIALDKYKPVVVVSFPIDRYVSDVLERLAKARNIPYFELTASLISGMSMLLYRGELVEAPTEPTAALVDATVAEIATPTFTPSYVQKKSKYTIWRFLKVFSYFKIRGLGFWLISHIKNDPLNLHYMDSQGFLGHKPRLSDVQIVNLLDANWRSQADRFPQEKRVFFGLQLFPEASIDYWIPNLDLLEYEDIVVEAAMAFSKAGYQILVKDHPLQFGFRQCEFIKRLRAVPNVLIVPYDVTGNELMDLCDVNFTLTGTLGLQAALLGKKSVVTRNYYSTEEDFITFSTKEEVPDLPARVAAFNPAAPLAKRQHNIIHRMLKGSFSGNFFTFKGFDRNQPHPEARKMANELGTQLKLLTKV